MNEEYEKVKEKMAEILMPTGFVTLDRTAKSCVNSNLNLYVIYNRIF